MSKHKKRDRDREDNMGNNQFGFNMKNNPFGIDPAQLIGMLGNMDMGRLNSMLSTMNKNGVDINSVNGAYQNGGVGNIGNSNNMNNSNNNFNPFGNMQGLGGMPNGNFDINSLNSFAEKLGIGNTKANTGKSDLKHNSFDFGEKSKGEKEVGNDIFDKEKEDDDNIKLLLSIRNIVDSSKKGFIDRIIEKYRDGEFDEP